MHQGKKPIRRPFCSRKRCHKRPGQSKVQIFASDIDEDALEITRGGLFGNAIAIDVPAPLLDKYFVKEQVGYPQNAESVIAASAGPKVQDEAQCLAIEIGKR